MVIVAAVDSSEKASKVIDQANKLAEKFGDVIHVAHVMKKSEVIEAGLDPSETDNSAKMRATAKEVGLKKIDDHPGTVEMEVVGLVGNPADEIVEYATEQNARYIVVSPKRQSQTGKILFGSVAQSILLNASCPVVSVTDL
jgi:nucleotide-binding universal stress UspA family protein